MISWYWLIVSLFIGFGCGFILYAIARAASEGDQIREINSAYWQGREDEAERHKPAEMHSVYDGMEI